MDEQKINEGNKMKEGAQSGDQEAYTIFFNKMLAKYNVKSPDELDAETKRKFFDEVDAGWKSKEESGVKEGFTTISFKQSLDQIVNLKDLPKEIQNEIKSVNRIDSHGFAELYGLNDRQLVFSIGGTWGGVKDNEFTATSYGSNKFQWNDRTNQLKKLKESAMGILETVAFAKKAKVLSEENFQKFPLSKIANLNDLPSQVKTIIKSNQASLRDDTEGGLFGHDENGKIFSMNGEDDDKGNVTITSFISMNLRWVNGRLKKFQDGEYVEVKESVMEAADVVKVDAKKKDTKGGDEKGSSDASYVKLADKKPEDEEPVVLTIEFPEGVFLELELEDDSAFDRIKVKAQNLYQNNNDTSVIAKELAKEFTAIDWMIKDISKMNYDEDGEKSNKKADGPGEFQPKNESLKFHNGPVLVEMTTAKKSLSDILNEEMGPYVVKDRIKHPTSHKSLDLEEGKSYPVRYVLYINDGISNDHWQPWNVTAGSNKTGYGTPNDKNLEKYIMKYAKSLEKGGANEHISKNLGRIPYPISAKIVDQSLGKVVATWKAGKFQVFESVNPKPSKAEIAKFVDYVLSFYGKGQMYSHFFDGGVSEKEVMSATEEYLKKTKIPFDGDTTDREAVRDIMLANRKK